MRIVWGPAACDGFGFCAEVLPEVIGLDEWGYPVVAGGTVPAELVRAARQAVRRCPRRALALVPGEVSQRALSAGSARRAPAQP